MLFDTHTHINVDKFKGEENEIIRRANENGVDQMAIVGFDYPTIDKALELTHRHDRLYAIIGWHPTEAGTYSDEVEAYLIDRLSDETVVAMGEMGLDYYWDTAPKSVQQDVFRRQIRVAKEFGLPISIHNREATEDTYKVLKDEHAGDTGGIMHSFNLDTYWMEKFIDIGMHISLSGVVTFKNAPEVKEVAKQVPADKLLIETDAPYLAPMPNRGKRNEPAYVRYLAEEIASLRQMPFEEVARLTTENARDLFKLKG
ncbi:TatD family hydrolase [Alkalibacterium thalassium]|uniref:TatD DNase family protein n=1 Tax=Alkalibacterium thalassium TaxID=426701 RepID=A0A1G8YVU2_9LACT|nr:TatD family hydrolase [Alkalibacterium thalassium]SDK06901.1 TatD DNase family protein [Alkalibacterium thalassium]